MKRSNLVDSLEVFLRKGYGRCQDCGAHPEKQQGHLDTLPTESEDR